MSSKYGFYDIDTIRRGLRCRVVYVYLSPGTPVQRGDVLGADLGATETRRDSDVSDGAMESPRAKQTETGKGGGGTKMLLVGIVRDQRFVIEPLLLIRETQNTLLLTLPSFAAEIAEQFQQLRAAKSRTTPKFGSDKYPAILAVASIK